MSEVLAQLEKKGGGGLPDNLDNFNVCGTRGVSRGGFYTINGVTTSFETGSVSDSNLFCSFSNSTFNITFTKKGLYQIAQVKQGVTPVSIKEEKEIGDTIYVFPSANNAYFSTTVIKLD